VADTFRNGDYRYTIKVERLARPIGTFKYIAEVEEIIKVGIDGSRLYPVNISDCYGQTKAAASRAAKEEAEQWIAEHSEEQSD
jgi:hypothetical protein